MTEKNLTIEENFTLAVQNYQKNNLEAAKNLYVNILKIDPNHVVAHYNLGIIFKELGELQKAISCYEKVIQINSNHRDAYNNLGNVLKKSGEFQKAINSFKKAIEIDPNFVIAYYNLGILFKELGDLQKALSCFQKAVELNPNHAGAYNNLGNILQESGEPQKAVSCYEKAVELNPNYPKAKLNEAYVRLELGEFEAGWKKYESRFDKGMPRLYLFDEDMIGPMRYKIDKLWDGNYLDGTLLVWGEQGVGDQIMFASMLNDLKKFAKNIILEIDKRLINLFKRYYEKTNFSNIKVINLEKKLVNNFDKHIAIGSLGQYLRKTRKSFETTPQQYLIPSFEKEKEIKSNFFVNKKFKIGISWRSLNAKHQYRNIDLKKMLPILSNPNCDFINLQFGKFEEDLHQLQLKYGMKIRTIKEIDNYNNIDDLAALINCLDLVINVQNSNADLAAALGKKTWVMVTKNQEWRWSAYDKKSLWYPTTKLFTQKKVGNWNSVINDIDTELRKLLK